MSQTASSITEALNIATGQKGACMVKIGRGSYEVRTFSPYHNAFRASASMDYHRARAYLTEARHHLALVALGWEPDDADEESYLNAHGSLRDRISRSVAKRAAKGGAA